REWTRRTASRKVFEGMVPVSTHTPPTVRWRSMMATRLPSLAAWMAPRCPAGPLPMQTRSNSASLMGPVPAAVEQDFSPAGRTSFYSTDPGNRQCDGWASVGQGLSPPGMSGDRFNEGSRYGVRGPEIVSPNEEDRSLGGSGRRG